MYTLFAETVRKLRIERGLSQKALGDMLFIDQSTVARWESGLRLPEAVMIPRLVKCLGVDANTLFNLVTESDYSPNVIIVDDDEIILSHALTVLKGVMQIATVTGFIWPQEAVEYAKANRVELALLDIELGTASGLDLCHTLLEINPCTNVVYLTAYPEYSIDAWSTGASGFILKPLTPEGVIEQLKKLRIPYSAGGCEA